MKTFKSNRINSYNIIELLPSTIEYALMSEDNLLRQAVIDILITSDATLRGKIIERDGSLNNAKFVFEPSEVSAVDDFIYNELWTHLNDQVYKDIAAAYYRRFSVIEIKWLPDGRIKQLLTHDPYSFEFKKEELKIYDAQRRDFHNIPKNKAIVAYSPFNYLGQPISIIEQLAPIVVAKYYSLLKQWPRFSEVFGNPLIIGKYAAEGDKAAILNGIKTMGSSGGAAIPNDSSLDLVQTSGQTAQTYEKYIDTANSEIAYAMLGQTLSSQGSDGGSYALSKTHGQTKADVVDDILQTVANAINEQLIKPLVEVKFGKEIENYPIIKLETPESAVEKLSRDRELHAIGCRFTKKYFMENYGLSEEDIAEEQGQE